jgi:hypothetical protein
MGIEAPEGLSAQELRLWQDGFVAGRSFEQREQRVKHRQGESSLSDDTPFPLLNPDSSPADEGQSPVPSETTARSGPAAAPHSPNEAA